MSGILITNNPLVQTKYLNNIEIIYLEDADLMKVFYVVRDKIHAGYGLLTHPMSGSVKPNQTPYKSIVVTKDKAQLDVDSIKIMEHCIAIASQQLKVKNTPIWPRKVLEDFQLIDLSLIASGIESLNQF